MTKTELSRLPQWMREFHADTHYADSHNEVVASLAFASGVAIGQAMCIDEMQAKLDEMTEMLEISRAFQREKDAQLIEQHIEEHSWPIGRSWLREQPL